VKYTVIEFSEIRIPSSTVECFCKIRDKVGEYERLKITCWADEISTSFPSESKNSNLRGEVSPLAILTLGSLMNYLSIRVAETVF